jgi:hypothetical protein
LACTLAIGCIAKSATASEVFFGIMCIGDGWQWMGVVHRRQLRFIDDCAIEVWVIDICGNRWMFECDCDAVIVVRDLLWMRVLASMPRCNDNFMVFRVWCSLPTAAPRLCSRVIVRRSHCDMHG